jgi:hypothetical protein
LSWTPFFVVNEGCILSAVSFNRPQLSAQDIKSAIHDYDELSDEQKLPYFRLASAKVADEYSYASGATSLDTERWMNAEFDAAIEKLLKIN